jgi:hypothetical protein
MSLIPDSRSAVATLSTLPGPADDLARVVPLRANDNRYRK